MSVSSSMPVSQANTPGPIYASQALTKINQKKKSPDHSPSRLRRVDEDANAESRELSEDDKSRGPSLSGVEAAGDGFKSRGPSLSGVDAGPRPPDPAYRPSECGKEQPLCIVFACSVDRYMRYEAFNAQTHTQRYQCMHTHTHTKLTHFRPTCTQTGSGGAAPEDNKPTSAADTDTQQQRDKVGGSQAVWALCFAKTPLL